MTTIYMDATTTTATLRADIISIITSSTPLVWMDNYYGLSIGDIDVIARDGDNIIAIHHAYRCPGLWMLAISSSPLSIRYMTVRDMTHDHVMIALRGDIHAYRHIPPYMMAYDDAQALLSRAAKHDAGLSAYLDYQYGHSMADMSGEANKIIDRVIDGDMDVCDIPHYAYTDDTVARMLCYGSLDIMSIPGVYITQSAIDMAIDCGAADSMMYDDYQRDLLSYDNLVTILGQDASLAGLLPARDLEAAMCRAIDDDPYAVINLGVDANLITADMVLLAIDGDMGVISRLTSDMIDHGIVIDRLIALSRTCHETAHYTALLLAGIDKHSNNLGAMRDFLTSIPKKMITPAICRIAVSYCADNIADMPADMRDDSLRMLAVSLDGITIRHMSTRHKTMDVCRAAVNNDPTAIAYISRLKRTDYGL